MHRVHAFPLLLVLCALPFLPACGSSGSDDPAPTLPTLYVNAATGSDANPGTQALPFETITHALSVAVPTQAVQVEPGTYDAANGEVFPLVVGVGVTLQGDVPNRGNGPVPTQILGGAEPPPALGYPPALAPLTALTLVPLTGSTVQGFKIHNTDLVKNFQNDVVLMHSGVTLHRNTWFNTADTGIYVIHDASNHVITQNYLTGRSQGLSFREGGVGSRVEGNEFTANSIGVEYDAAGGDLGGGGAGSGGGNLFFCNSENDLWTVTPSITIDAQGNHWDHVPPTVGPGGGRDIRNGGGATIITTGAQVVIHPCP